MSSVINQAGRKQFATGNTVIRGNEFSYNDDTVKLPKKERTRVLPVELGRILTTAQTIPLVEEINFPRIWFTVFDNNSVELNIKTDEYTSKKVVDRNSTTVEELEEEIVKTRGESGEIEKVNDPRTDGTTITRNIREEKETRVWPKVIVKNYGEIDVYEFAQEKHSDN